MTKVANAFLIQQRRCHEMKQTKSKAAYTNKWLSRNRRFWHEEHVNSKPVIIVDKEDAPKIVLARIKEINAKRGWNGFDSTDECIRSIFLRYKNKCHSNENKNYSDEEYS